MAEMGSKIGDAFVEIGATDRQFRGVMGGVERRLASFGTMASRWMRRGAVAIGAAMAAGVGYSIKAGIQQEEAEMRLRVALKANGDAVDQLMPKYAKFASAIQQQTRYGDESVLGMMAQLRNLGVMPDRMEEATKGAIGLAKALKLDADSSARYTALAMQGEFTVLQRYVPALRTATTEAEKQRIVLELMQRGFEQERDSVDNVAGAFGQAKNAIGDVFEVIGTGIMQAIGLKGALQDVRDAAGELTETLIGLRDKGRFIEWASTATTSLKLLWNEMQLGPRIIDMYLNKIPHFGKALEKALEQTRKNEERILAEQGKNIDKLMASRNKDAANVADNEGKKRAEMQQTMAMFSSYAEIVRAAQREVFKAEKPDADKAGGAEQVKAMVEVEQVAPTIREPVQVIEERKPEQPRLAPRKEPRISKAQAAAREQYRVRVQEQRERSEAETWLRSLPDITAVSGEPAFDEARQALTEGLDIWIGKMRDAMPDIDELLKPPPALEDIDLAQATRDQTKLPVPPDRKPMPGAEAMQPLQPLGGLDLSELFPDIDATKRVLLEVMQGLGESMLPKPDVQLDGVRGVQPSELSMVQDVRLEESPITEEQGEKMLTELRKIAAKQEPLPAFA